MHDDGAGRQHACMPLAPLAFQQDTRGRRHAARALANEQSKRDVLLVQDARYSTRTAACMRRLLDAGALVAAPAAIVVTAVIAAVVVLEVRVVLAMHAARHKAAAQASVLKEAKPQLLHASALA